jgi:hypothetical protein
VLVFDCCATADDQGRLIANVRLGGWESVDRCRSTTRESSCMLGRHKKF